MKKLIIYITAAAIMLLGGCSYTQTSAEALVKPPKLSSEQNEIYTALKNGVGSDVTLKYPKKGEYTSAFVIKNLDDEQTNEALAFYNVSNSRSTSLYITTLDIIDGHWEATYDAYINASEVEKVSFIKYDQKTYIAVGFTLPDSFEKLLVIFSYKKGILQEKYRTFCMDYDVFDINSDNSDELITFTASREKGIITGIKANMLRVSISAVSKLSETEMNGSVSSYNEIKHGKLSDGTPALYIDGIMGDKCITEILICRSENLKNLIYNGKSDDLSGKTMRDKSISSDDLSINGIIEIPITKVINGYENKPHDEQEYFTEWYIYDAKKGLVVNRYTYTSYTLGYMFSIPTDFIGKITVDSLSGENEVYFCEYNKSQKEEENLQKRLFSIKAVKRVDYEAQSNKSKYSMLKDNGQLIYMYSIQNQGTSLSVSNTLIKDNFRLL